ncbi:MAG: hypothetical protein R3C24_06630 [Cyanobacteriota/Melainabacteria group bacterium]|nr:hypothetical protein [Cyanobacteria bacterium HKST-UBA01]
MQYGTIKIEVGSPVPSPQVGSVNLPVSAISSDTNALVVFQKLLERNPDFNSDPSLYRGKIGSHAPGTYDLKFTVPIATSDGKQDRDLTVFDRLIGSLVSGLMANQIRCYAPVDG